MLELLLAILTVATILAALIGVCHFLEEVFNIRGPETGFIAGSIVGVVVWILVAVLESYKYAS